MSKEQAIQFIMDKNDKITYAQAKFYVETVLQLEN